MLQKLESKCDLVDEKIKEEEEERHVEISTEKMDCEGVIIVDNVHVEITQESHSSTSFIEFLDFLTERPNKGHFETILADLDVTTNFVQNVKPGEISSKKTDVLSPTIEKENQIPSQVCSPSSGNIQNIKPGEVFSKKTYVFSPAIEKENQIPSQVCSPSSGNIQNIKPGEVFSKKTYVLSPTIEKKNQIPSQECSSNIKNISGDVILNEISDQVIINYIDAEKLRSESHTPSINKHCSSEKVSSHQMYAPSPAVNYNRSTIAGGVCSDQMYAPSPAFHCNKSAIAGGVCGDQLWAPSPTVCTKVAVKSVFNMFSGALTSQESLEISRNSFEKKIEKPSLKGNGHIFYSFNYLFICCLYFSQLFHNRNVN